MLVLNFFCLKHILLYHPSLLQVFQFSLFQVKRLNYCEGFIIFSILNTNFKKISLITFSIIAFYEIFHKSRSIFNLFKAIYRQILWHYPFIQIIYVLIFKIWWFFIFIIIFHVFIISLHISINSMTYSTSDSFFYH